jgi:hypothetical protein
MAKKNVSGEKKADGYFVVDLRNIVANTAQSRQEGVCKGLKSVGVGVFDAMPVEPPKEGEEAEQPKKPIWELLLSKDVADQAKGIGLMEEYEDGIVTNAASMWKLGQLHNIRLVPAQSPEGESIPGKWDVVCGMRRCLMRAYNYAKSNGEQLANIKAEVFQSLEGNEQFIAVAENEHRLSENPMDRALSVYNMKHKAGMTFKQIAEKSNLSDQTIRNLYALNHATEEEKKKLRDGLAGSAKVLDNIKKRAISAGGKAPAQGEAPVEKATNRLRSSTAKTIKELLSAVEIDGKILVDGKEMVEKISEERFLLLKDANVRKWLSLDVGVEYKSYPDHLKAIKDAAKAKAEAEAAELKRKADEIKAAAAKAEAEEEAAAELAAQQAAK